jgi:hypothetical protein
MRRRSPASAGGEIGAFQPLPPDPVDLRAAGPGLPGRGQ